MDEIKALLAFEDVDPPPQDQAGAGPSQKPTASSDAPYISDERLDFEDSDVELEESSEDEAGGD